MATINNDGSIAISRGDIFRYPLFINSGDKDEPQRYSLIDYPTSKIYFSIMQPNQSFEQADIRKIFTVSDCNQFGDVMITLNSKETMLLAPGKYYYQVKIVLEDGRINTITDKEIVYVR